MNEYNLRVAEALNKNSVVFTIAPLRERVIRVLDREEGIWIIKRQVEYIFTNGQFIGETFSLCHIIKEIHSTRHDLAEKECYDWKICK